MHRELHIDVETFSSEDIKSAGVYKYCESPDFELLMASYAFDTGPTSIWDITQNEELPEDLVEALKDPSIKKLAHNANFERNVFRAIGIDVPIEEWECSAIKAAYCGLPLSLEMVSKALNLQEKGKLSTGKALIRYFCIPCKPTKANGGRTRNLPQDDLEKWEEFKRYCINDTEAEREICRILKPYEIPRFETAMYRLDQQINDRGIMIDTVMASNAYELDQKHSAVLLQQIKEITGLENPNSPAQLKKWLSNAIGTDVQSLAKGTIPTLIEEAGDGPAGEVLRLRGKASKTSIKKYVAMLNCVCLDQRAHGLLQFYGASRTGRWAGRLVQLQNLPQNHLSDLEMAREVFASGDYEAAKMLYEDISSTLSQLIRTAFIAKPGHTFAVADFSAIEARVIAWLASEDWRLDVFNSHGKIYEASASMMFNVPIEQVTKGSKLRDMGKVAELALGYQGALGALKTMGGERMGLSEDEMRSIVKKWRAKNPKIVDLWDKVQKCAMIAVRGKKAVKLTKYRGLIFSFDGTVLTITLPSGRKLFYREAQIFEKTTHGANGPWTRAALRYKGIIQATRQWGWVDTYGGKLVENIVQAIARDLLADSMLRLNKQGYEIVMHVHDEVVCEISYDIAANDQLEIIEDTMGQPIPWAEGLPLVADGYITPFYKKD